MHINRIGAQGAAKAFRSSTARILAAIFVSSILLSASWAQGNSVTSRGKDSERAARVRALNNVVLQLHEQMQENASGAPAIRSQAAIVLAQRAASLQSLIQEDPRAARSLAFSPELLADLADKFSGSAASLESHGTWRGKVEVLVSDDRVRRQAKTTVLLYAGSRKIDVRLPDGILPNLKSGDDLEVTGVLVGTTMAAENGTAQTTTSPAASCSTFGNQNIAVLLVNLPGAALPATVTPASMQSVFFGTAGQSVDGYLREASYGQTSASGSVFGPFNLTGSYASCGTSQMETDAINAAAAAGVSLQGYSRVVVVFPDVIGCGWSGMATIGCSTLNLPSGASTVSSAFLNADYANVQVATHELGHNLGLRHAQARDYGTEPLGPLNASGTLYEYGNEFSTMGNWTPGQYAAPHKCEVLNWMAQGTDYQIVQGSGSYTIQPLESTAGGLKALKIQRGSGNAGYYLWIEYRQPTGSYDTTYYTTQPYSGASINYEDPTTGTQTQLLDFTPESDLSNGEGSDFGDPALASGKAWTDPYSDLSIAVTSATASGLSVSVNYGGAVACTRANPTVSLTPLDPSIYPASNATYNLSIKNNDSSGCPADTYSLTSSQPSAWPTSFTTNSVSLSPGQSAVVTMTKTGPAGTPPGTYAVDANAGDGSFVGTSTANITVMAAPTLSVSVSVPASSYARRSTVPITAAVVNGSTPVSGASVTFTLTTASGSTVTQNATTGANGSASWSYRLGPKSPTGAYSVSARASVGSKGTAATATQAATSNIVSFTVQ